MVTIQGRDELDFTNQKRLFIFNYAKTMVTSIKAVLTNI